MGLIEIIVYIAIVGLIVWGITTLIPMPEPFRKAIYVISVIGLVLYILTAFGFLHSFHDLRIGR